MGKRKYLWLHLYSKEKNAMKNNKKKNSQEKKYKNLSRFLCR